MPNLRGKTWTTSTPANVEDAQYWEDHLISDAAALKAASSVQSVNSITPDAQGNVDVVALPAGGTAGQVLTKQSSTTGDADWEDPASSGHTIEDEDGNIMPYQETLQFENAEVTNDSVNNKTIVDCKGSKGDAATITVGTVTTLPAGSDATVTNSGTSSDAVFDFGIPKGADGEGAVDSVNGYTGVVVLDASDVGALPDSTTIPTKTSELDNDSGFVTSSAIPTSLSELSDDATHRLVTDAEKTDWDAKVSEPLLEDTVGWVGKNRLKIPSSVVSSGIYTVNRNSDGEVTSIVANGTPSVQSNFQLVTDFTLDKPMILSGCPSGGSTNDYFIYAKNSNNDYYYDFGNGVTLPSGSYSIMQITTRANVSMSNKEFRPMLRDASITDSTFEPYHPPVSEWGYTREEAIVTGVHQFLNIKTTSGSENDVTWTVNADKSISISTAQGGASATTVIELTDAIQNVKSGVAYTLMGCPSGGSGSTYKLDFGNGSYIDYGDSTTFDGSIISGNKARIVIYSGAVLSNKVFKPLLKLAADTSDELSKFAMTNRELTEKVTQNEATIALESGITKWTENVVCKQGKVCFMNLTVSGTFTANTEVLVGTIPVNYRPRQILFFPLCTTSGYGYVKVGQDGTIKMNNVSGNATNIGAFGSWLVP